MNRIFTMDDVFQKLIGKMLYINQTDSFRQTYLTGIAAHLFFVWSACLESTWYRIPKKEIVQWVRFEKEMEQLCGILQIQWKWMEEGEKYIFLFSKYPFTEKEKMKKKEEMKEETLQIGKNIYNHVIYIYDKKRMDIILLKKEWKHESEMIKEWVDWKEKIQKCFEFQKLSESYPILYKVHEMVHFS